MNEDKRPANTRCYCGGELQDGGRTPLGQPLLYCTACGYARTQRQPTANSRRLHEGEHPSASQGENGQRFPSLIGKVRQHCADYRARQAFPPGKRAGALDFGCGQGFYMGALRHRGFDPTGIEISTATAKRALGAGHRVFTSLDETDNGNFDALVSIHVIEHLEEPDGFLQDIAKRLSPRARFLIEVPHATGWQGRVFGERWLHRESALHVHHFSPRALRSLLARNGFQVEHESHYSFEHGLLGWIQSMYNLVFPYNRFFRHIVLNNSWQARLAAWPEVVLFPLAFVAGSTAFVVEALSGSGPVIRVSGRYTGDKGHA